ncbi:hypothetical protein QD460_25395 [Rhizobium jaguaris]|nr:hypothetical protein [Rhizobium jaguaris]
MIVVFLLGILSDKFFVVFFSVPYAVSLLVVNPSATGVRRFVLFILETCAAFALVFLAERMLIEQVMDPVAFRPVARVASILTVASRSPGLAILLFAASIPAGLFVVRWLRWKINHSVAMPEAIARAWIFLSLLTICGLGAGILLWREDQVGYARYLVGMQIGGLILAAMILAQWLRSKGSLSLGVLACLTTLCMVSLSQSNPVNLDKPFLQRAKTADTLAACRENLHLKSGLAQYWLARKLSSMTNWDIQINQLEPAVPRPFFWGSNLQWYYYDMKSAQPSVTNFVIGNGFEQTDIVRYLGEPTYKANCDEFQILVYSDPDELRSKISNYLYLNAVAQQAMKHFPRSFRPDQVKYELSVVSHQIGSLDGGILDAVAPRDRAGFLFFGPYIHLDKGHYETSIEYSCAGNTSENIFDVVANQGKAQFAREDIRAGDLRCDGNRRTLTLTFDLKASADNIEFRGYYGGTGSLKIFEINLPHRL